MKVYGLPEPSSCACCHPTLVRVMECPACGVAFPLAAHGGLVRWVCPSGHVGDVNLGWPE